MFEENAHVGSLSLSAAKGELIEASKYRVVPAMTRELRLLINRLEERMINTGQDPERVRPRPKSHGTRKRVH